ncbi:hypothetical protein [Glaciihabitans sp. UYNi722]|uniref:hypothetical protein n=1 Tax=Glaciihabitans sp. UYNi722 TaxID=3156344 RepID=UPI00339A1DF5
MSWLRFLSLTTPSRRRVLAGTAAALSLCAAMLAVASPADADTGAPEPGAVLGSIATLAQSAVAANNATAIERGHIQAAIASVHANYPDDVSPWSDTAGTSTPATSQVFSVRFDNGSDGQSGLPESFGMRAGVLTRSPVGDGFVGTVFTVGGLRIVCGLDATINTAALLLAAIGDDMTCPVASLPVASSVTSMWAWGNSVDPLLDNRGLGQEAMTPEAIATFAHERNLSKVYLGTPWAADQGAIGVWVLATVDALHAEGIQVAALGGDSSWLERPALIGQWISAARSAAPFDAIELDVEPWAGQPEPDFSVITPKFVTLLGAAHDAAGPLPLGIDLPWWLTTKNTATGNVFDTLLGHVDSVAIVAFSNHASGTDGIIALATPAVLAATAQGKPFTIGVETDTPEIAGGSQFTFFDRGQSALNIETRTVREAFDSTVGYAGVTVEHLLSWKKLGN